MSAWRAWLHVQLLVVVVLLGGRKRVAAGVGSVRWVNGCSGRALVVRRADACWEAWRLELVPLWGIHDRAVGCARGDFA